jgi:hypothetical protein
MVFKIKKWRNHFFIWYKFARFAYSSFQRSAYSFDNPKTSLVRVLSFDFAVGKIKTAISPVKDKLETN